LTNWRRCRWLLCFGDAANRLFLIWTTERDLVRWSTLNSVRAHAINNLAPPFLLDASCFPKPNRNPSCRRLVLTRVASPIQRETLAADGWCSRGLLPQSRNLVAFLCSSADGSYSEPSGCRCCRSGVCCCRHGFGGEMRDRYCREGGQGCGSVRRHCRRQGRSSEGLIKCGMYYQTHLVIWLYYQGQFVAKQNCNLCTPLLSSGCSTGKCRLQVSCEHKEFVEIRYSRNEEAIFTVAFGS
jgi:hypothetical protein